MVHILIADRELLFTEALAVALESPGLLILGDHPGTGLEAVKAAIAHKPYVVVLDYWLEGIVWLPNNLPGEPGEQQHETVMGG